MASAQGSGKILAQVLADAQHALGADAAVLLMRTDSTLAARSAAGQAGELEGQTIDDDALPAVMEALSSHHPVFLDDVSSARLSHGGPERFDIASCLVAPLIVRDQASGGLFFSWKQNRPFALYAVDFVKRLASLLALLVANMDMRKQTKE